MLLSVNLTDISGGNILVALSVVLTLSGAMFMLYRASPIGSDAVEGLKNLLEIRTQELAEAVKIADRRFSEIGALTEKAHQLEVDLAKCQAQPKTEELAAAIREMSSGFQTHRSELLATQNRILSHLEKNQETIGSMHQALIVLVDRNREHRSNDQDNGSPPLSV